MPVCHASAGTLADDDSLILKAISLSIIHEYEKSKQLLDELIRKDPTQPVGYFFKAAVIQAQMMDFETDRWRSEFLDNIDLTLSRCDRKNSDSSEFNVDHQFYKGSALSYLAFYAGRQGKYVTAIRQGLSAVSILKKIVHHQPDYYDAYFGIGTFRFWRSQLTRHLSWLPLVPDDRELGIRMIETAIEKGKFTRAAAMNELVWMLLEYDKPERAYQWALTGLQHFPDSRFFLWGAAKCAMALEKYDTAQVYFQRILDAILQNNPNNHYNEYLCRLNLARCHIHLEEYDCAQQQIDQLKALPLSSNIIHRLKKQRNQCEQLERQVTKIRLNDQSCLPSSTKHDSTNEQRRY